MAVATLDKKPVEKNLEKWFKTAKYYTIKERDTKVVPKPGEIYTVDMGVNVGSEINGVRPAIIISSTRFNMKSGTVLVVPLTGHEFAKPGQILICDEILEEGNVSGVGKVEMVTSISKGRIGEYIGKLNEKGRKVLAQKLQRFISPIHKKTFLR